MGEESPPAGPTLFEWAGGTAAIRGLIDAFYDRVEHDDLLSPFFPGGVSEEHRDHVAAWWSEVFGGPARYTAELGGYEEMVAHHRDLAITADQRFRFASLMSLAADDGTFLPTRSSAPRWSPTSSGARGSRIRTRSSQRKWLRTHPFLAGAGVRRRPTGQAERICTGDRRWGEPV